MARISIMRADNVVSVDGRALDVSCASISSDIRAVQWYDSWGEVEYGNPPGTSPESYKPNTKITSIAQFQAIVDAWQARANQVDNPPAPPPPTAAQLAEAARVQSIKSDAGRIDLVNRLKSSNAAQIDTWVDTNVSNIAQARTVIKSILKLIALDGHVE